MISGEKIHIFVNTRNIINTLVVKRLRTGRQEDYYLGNGDRCGKIPQDYFDSSRPTSRNASKLYYEEYHKYTVIEENNPDVLTCVLTCETFFWQNVF